MYQNRYAYRRRQRQKRRFRTVYTVAMTWFVASGAASGVLIGSLLLNVIWPDHPVYVAVRNGLRALLAF